jgi:hypothetical protein
MESPLRVEGLVVGRNYRIIFKTPTDRLPREIVASYVDAEVQGGQLNSLVLDGRPDFGTTHLPVEWIREMWITSRRKSPPTIYQGETRVY